MKIDPDPVVLSILCDPLKTSHQRNPDAPWPVIYRGDDFPT